MRQRRHLNRFGCSEPKSHGFRLLRVIGGAALALGCGAHGQPPPAREPAPNAATESVPSDPQAASKPPTQAGRGEAGSPARSEPPAKEGVSLGAAPKSLRPAAPPPLPANTRVLHVGDSFAGALGIALNKELKARGIRGILKYETASYIPTWASAGKLSSLVATYRPDLVLITLGANEVEIAEPSQRIRAIRRLVGALGERPCVWIAPPLWKEDTGLMDVLRENVEPCLYMDTDAIISDMPRVRDKIHPTMNARERWARVVIDWLSHQRDPSGESPWALRQEPVRFPPVSLAQEASEQAER